MARRASSKRRRLREWIEHFFFVIQNVAPERLRCKYPKCKTPEFRVKDFFNTYGRDNCTVHHVDCNRSHNTFENLWVVHRGCHRKWHWELDHPGEEVPARLEESEDED